MTQSQPAAVITGAAGGIGGALVTGFRDAGYEVTAVDRAGNGGNVVLDVTDAVAVAEFGAGIGSLDVLVNAAGVLRRTDEFDADVFAEVLAVNLTGAMRLAVALRPALAKAGGSVVNIGSMYSLFGAPYAPAYAASKGGIVQLTKSLAVAWARDGIRVNAIAPGWIVTRMSQVARENPERNREIVARTPMGRWGTPEELVGPALFLASDAARYVTGVVLPVDGGYSVA